MAFSLGLFPWVWSKAGPATGRWEKLPDHRSSASAWLQRLGFRATCIRSRQANPWAASTSWTCPSWCRELGTEDPAPGFCGVRAGDTEQDPEGSGTHRPESLSLHHDRFALRIIHPRSLCGEHDDGPVLLRKLGVSNVRDVPNATRLSRAGFEPRSPCLQSHRLVLHLGGRTTLCTWFPVRMGSGLNVHRGRAASGARAGGAGGLELT